MIRIFSDVGKNRIVLELVGRPTKDEVAAAEREVQNGLPRLRAPIDVLSDVSQLESLADAPTDVLQRVGHMLRDKGVRRVVRVVGRATEGALQMQRIARLFTHSAHLAFSREEAEQVFSDK